jgi:hypothetical protein
MIYIEMWRACYACCLWSLYCVRLVIDNSHFVLCLFRRLLQYLVFYLAADTVSLLLLLSYVLVYPHVFPYHIADKCVMVR